jgi:hypothetical protein
LPALSEPAEETARLMRELADSRKTPLQLIATLMSRLSYSDLMTMAADLHSDSEMIGKTPASIADLLCRWAFRQLSDRGHA